MSDPAEDRTRQLRKGSPAQRLADYDAIEAALLQSPRGRWFLAEYARRNRSADTQMLLDALTKLELDLLRPERQREASNVLADLIEMSEAIARTRREIAAIKPPSQIIAITEELDSIVEAAEKATSDILEAAEEIQEVAWTLREAGSDSAACDTLDRRATDIYTACSFQDITGQRTAKAVKVLHFIERRINAMIEIWGIDDIGFADLATEVQRFEEDEAAETDLRTEGLKQEDVDSMLLPGGTEPAAGAEPETASGAAETAPPATAVVPDEPSQKAATAFEPPEALSLARLHAVKRAVLFGQ